MNTASESILLPPRGGRSKPVTFRYKKQLTPRGFLSSDWWPRNGRKVNPTWWFPAATANPYTVRYEAERDAAQTNSSKSTAR
jgi:hypothetical protein